MKGLKTVLLTLTYCWLTASALQAEDLTIGWIGALTGDAAGIGTEILASLETAVSEVNAQGGIAGRPIKVVAEDDGYVVARALTAYEKLRSSVNSHIIFVSTYGAMFALGRRPEQHGLLIIDTLDCNDELVKVSNYHFCLASRTESIAENFIKAIQSRGGGKIAVLYEEEAWFNFIVRGLKQALGPNLLEVTAPVHSGDYQAELLQIKQNGAKHLILLGNDSMGRAVKQAAVMQLNVPLYSIAGVMSPGYQKLAGSALEGVIVSHWEAPRAEAFRRFQQSFMKKTGRGVALEFVAAPTYDAAQVVLAVLARAAKEHPTLAAAQLRTLLLESPAFGGVSGLIKFDPDGAVRSINETLFLYQQGTLRPWPDSPN